MKYPFLCYLTTMILFIGFFGCDNPVSKQEKDFYVYSGVMSYESFNTDSIDTILYADFLVKRCDDLQMFPCDTIVRNSIIPYVAEFGCLEEVLDTLEVTDTLFQSSGYFDISWEEPLLDSMWLKEIELSSNPYLRWKQNGFIAYYSLIHSNDNTLEDAIAESKIEYAVKLYRKTKI